MKIEQLFTYCLFVGTFLLGSCANELATDTGTLLPEGIYPLSLTATQGELVASPQTRVSDYEEGGDYKSKWTTGDQIKVMVRGGGNDMETTCTFAESGNITNYNPQLYWKTPQSSKINAWYSNITGQNTTSSTVYLADQSSGLAYVLKADEVDANYRIGNISLNFKHQLAKVRVKLEKGTTSEDLTDATVKMKGYCTSCTVSNGTVTASGITGDITMYKASYGSDIYYEACVVPGIILKDNIFEIIAQSGKKTMADLTSEITPQAGQVYVITLTVNKKGVNISDINETEYIVNGNILLKGDGQSKNLKLTVENGSKLTIENVVLAPQNNGNAIICKGGATITLKGENTLNGRDTNGSGGYCGILVENGTLTIEGDNSAKLTVTGEGFYGAGIGATNNANITINGGNIVANRNGVGQSAGIGSAGYEKTCGTITINGGTIQAWGGTYSAGIGGSNSGSCGDIIITGGNIEAYGGAQSPGIGNGDDASCGNITISGSNTIVYAKKGSGKNPSSIGSNNYNGQCGTVTIGPECKVTQE